MPQTDNFNRANSTDLGANWTILFGTLPWGITTNQAAGNNPGHVFYNAFGFASNHYSQIVRVTGGLQGPSVRLQETDNGYFLRTGNLATVLFRIDNQVTTSLQDLGHTPVDGNTYKLSISGSTMQCFSNGSQIGTDQTDATYTGGKPGIGTEAVVVADDWEGDDLGGAVSAKRLLTLGAG